MKVEETLEDQAWGITCPVCHAPVGSNCVSIRWSAVEGAHVPRLVESVSLHSKRVRRFEKFRMESEDVIPLADLGGEK